MTSFIKKIFTKAFNHKDSNVVNRTTILNYIANKKRYKTYLEIGVRNPKINFDKIIVPHKEGVDPNWIAPPKMGIMHKKESDTFFKSIEDSKKFDLIFIDGLHLYEQAYRDIINALKHLQPNGTIVIHDCNPPTEWHQRPIEEFDGNSPWNGTTWKAFVKLRCTNDNISMQTIDEDCGLGIITHGKQIIYNKEILDKCLRWNYFDNNKIELLNLISIKNFYDNN